MVQINECNLACFNSVSHILSGYVWFVLESVMLLCVSKPQLKGNSWNKHHSAFYRSAQRRVICQWNKHPARHHFQMRNGGRNRSMPTRHLTHPYGETRLTLSAPHQSFTGVTFCPLYTLLADADIKPVDNPSYRKHTKESTWWFWKSKSSQVHSAGHFCTPHGGKGVPTPLVRVSKVFLFAISGHKCAFLSSFWC